MGEQNNAPVEPAPALAAPAEPPLDLPLEVDDLEALPGRGATVSGTCLQEAGGQQPAG